MRKKKLAGIVVMLLLFMVSPILADELQSEDEFFQGFRPSTIDRSHLQKNPPRLKNSLPEGNVGASSLPSYYDLREHNGVTDVRKQDPWGTCWVFSALGSLESSYKKQYPWENPDFSEMFIAYFAYEDSRPGKSFNLFNPSKHLLRQGGTSDQVVALLSRLGIVDEYVLPYPNADYYTRPSKLPEEYDTAPIRLKEAYQLGSLTDELRETVKELVMNKGAVSVSYYQLSKWSYLSSGYRVYFSSTPAGEYGRKITNHAVDIVGWDDNFPRSRFTSYMPSRNGAWLIRNSHGTNSDKDAGGYFWMSYEQYIDDVTMFVADRTEDKLRHYGYDDLGRNAGSPLSWGESTWVANIFRAEASEALKYVGFYTADNNENYTINIYDLGTSRPFSPTNGTLIASKEGYSPYVGYHTEDFTSDRIAVAKGHYFSVVMKSVWPSCEGGDKAVVNAGESYYSNDGANWWDLGEGYRYNACIKAFTAPIKTSDYSLYAPKITTTSLPDAHYGEEYNARLSATGSASITYNAWGTEARWSGFLIDGQRLDGAHPSTNGLINGTINSTNPVGARYPYNVEITVTAENEWGKDEKTFTVLMKEKPVKPAITTSSLPDAYIGTSYSATITATGTTPITYQCTSAVAMSHGFLLDGKNFVYTSTNGLINGTITNPTSHSLPFTLNIKVTATNAGGSDTKTFTVTVREKSVKPTITTSSLPDGTAGESYSTAINAAGTTPITFSATGLPSGLSCSSAGKITGTPSSAGQYTVRISAANSAGSVSRTLTLTINNKPVAPAVDANLPECYVGEEYNGWIRVSGTTPITCTVSGLPSGLSRNSSTGTITDKAASAGTYTIKVDASNAAGSVSKSYSLTVKTRPVVPSITTTSLPQGKTDTAYSATLSATGTPPISWSATGLPSGLSCSSSGTISGTPAQAGTFTVKITASNSAGSATKTLTLNIAAKQETTTNEDDITETEKPKFKVANLTLSGQIAVNFYMNLPPIQGVNYYDGKNCYTGFDINGDTTSNNPQPVDG